MEKDLENSLIILNNVKGIEYVRPPILNFIKNLYQSYINIKNIKIIYLSKLSYLKS